MVGRKDLMSISDNSNTGERLQKIIAQAGITSRRDAEELIRDGMVTVNGKTAKLGDKAVIGKDAIKVNGKLILSAKEKVYYLFYKPKNVIAMIAEDEEGRPTIKDMIKRIKERVFTIGRMDFTGEGAILLTNDGELAQKLQKSNNLLRRYHVKIDRNPSSEDLARLARGGRIEGRSMQPHHVRLVENYNRNALVEISFEGMGSIEIRQYFENKGFFPEKVARVGIGHLRADQMAPGTWKKIEASSIEALFNQPELAEKHIQRLVEKSASKTRTIREDGDAPKSSRSARPPRSTPPASTDTIRPARSAERSGIRGMNYKGKSALDENFRFGANKAASDAKPRSPSFESRMERSSTRSSQKPASRTERGFNETRESSRPARPTRDARPARAGGAGAKSAKPAIRFKHSR